MNSPINANKITMPILIKLLATKMVANSFLGRSRSFEINEKALGCSSKPVSISDFVKEKNATSAPDTKAEQINKSNKRTRPGIKAVFPESKAIIKLEGSGSNAKRI